MNIRKYCSDPMEINYFENEGLERAERVGLALKEGAKSFEITFGDHILPQVFACPHGDGAGFGFSDGLTFRHDDEYYDEHPEERRRLDAAREMTLPYRQTAQTLFFFL